MEKENNNYLESEILKRGYELNPSETLAKQLNSYQGVIYPARCMKTGERVVLKMYKNTESLRANWRLEGFFRDFFCDEMKLANVLLKNPLPNICSYKECFEIKYTDIPDPTPKTNPFFVLEECVTNLTIF